MSPDEDVLVSESGAWTCGWTLNGGGKAVDFQVGEIIRMKKGHPCGANEWEILRIGMDFRLRCLKCGRQVMLRRKLVEKNFRGFADREQ